MPELAATTASITSGQAQETLSDAKLFIGVLSDIILFIYLCYRLIDDNELAVDMT